MCSMQRLFLTLALSTFLGVLGTSKAQAASITFSNETFSGGSGWGNVVAVLGLQQAPQTTSESGAVGWNGAADVRVGDYTQQSTTRTVAELALAGMTATDADFGVVFNMNETTGGSTVELQDLVVNFFSGAGALLFSAPYTCGGCAYPFPLTLNETSQGLGNSGFLFRVTLTDAERALFFGSPTNRIGLAATVWGTDAGAEQFYLADPSLSVPLDPPAAVPEPASLLLFGSGLAALVFRRMRARRS
jgi:hypothetical protein